MKIKIDRLLFIFGSLMLVAGLGVVVFKAWPAQAEVRTKTLITQGTNSFRVVQLKINTTVLPDKVCLGPATWDDTSDITPPAHSSKENWTVSTWSLEEKPQDINSTVKFRFNYDYSNTCENKDGFHGATTFELGTTDEYYFLPTGLYGGWFTRKQPVGGEIGAEWFHEVFESGIRQYPRNWNITGTLP